MEEISLPDSSESASPHRVAGDLASVGIDCLPVMLTTAGVEVDLVDADEALSLPDVPNGPEEEDDRERKIGLEEALGVVQVAREWRSNGHEELRCQCNENEEETDIRSGDTEDRLERNFVESAALVLPCLSESDMCLFIMLEILS